MSTCLCLDTCTPGTPPASHAAMFHELYSVCILQRILHLCHMLCILHVFYSYCDMYSCARVVLVFYTVFCYVFCQYSTHADDNTSILCVCAVFCMYSLCILCFSPCERLGPPHIYRRGIADVCTEESQVKSQEAEGAGSRGSEDSSEGA